jgi:hypothetical protein
VGKTCGIAKDYYNAFRLAPGWFANLGGLLALNRIDPSTWGVNIVTMAKDERDWDPNAESSSPFGLWRELNKQHVPCAGWYSWPKLYKDLPPDTFVLMVGYNVFFRNL